MQAVFHIANVKKDKEKIFLPFPLTLESIIFSTAKSNGINAISNKIEVKGMGGQASQAIKAVANPKV